MKNTLHPRICAVGIIVTLTTCAKRQDTHGSKNGTSSIPNPSSISDVVAMVEPDQSGKEFDDPSDSYFQAFLLIRAAGEIANREESIRKLQRALDLLRAVRKRYPEWKIDMVEARIRLTEETLAALSSI